MLQLAVFSLLACYAAAQAPQICPSGGLSPNQPGCKLCQCAVQPIFGCDANGGCATVLGVTACTGQCSITTTGYGIIGGAVAVLIAIIIALSCCCCGCSRCCRGDGGDRVVLISNGRDESRAARAPFLAQQGQYNQYNSRSPRVDPRYAKVGSA
jgi:hypothetical protein